MMRLCRFALLATLTISPILPGSFNASTAYAGALPSSTTKVKKRRKHKKNKEVVLKGHHGKRAHKPA